MDIVNFLLQNKDSLKDYFDNVQISTTNPIKIKAGGDNEGFGVTFAITGKLDNSIQTYEEKIEAIFSNYTKDSQDSIDYLNEFSHEINQPYKFITVAPFLKFNENPVMHAFQFSVKEINEWEKKSVENAATLNLFISTTHYHKQFSEKEKATLILKQ